MDNRLVPHERGGAGPPPVRTSESESWQEALGRHRAGSHTRNHCLAQHSHSFVHHLFRPARVLVLYARIFSFIFLNLIRRRYPSARDRTQGEVGTPTFSRGGPAPPLSRSTSLYSEGRGTRGWQASLSLGGILDDLSYVNADVQLS